MVLFDSLLLCLLIVTTTSTDPGDVDFSKATLDPATGLMCVYNQGNLQSQIGKIFYCSPQHEIGLANSENVFDIRD